MNNVNSITLVLMGIGLLPVAHFMDNLLLKYIVLIASIVLNLAAIVKNIKEKRNKQ